MKKSEEKKLTLVENLKQFGLDPEEWFIANNGSGFFDRLLLVNKQDPRFRLIGEKDQTGWRRIEILSV